MFNDFLRNLKKRIFYFIAFTLLFFIIMFIRKKNEEAKTMLIQKIKQDPIVCVGELLRANHIGPKGAHYLCIYVSNDILHHFETKISERCLDLGKPKYMYFVYEKGKPQNYISITKKEDYQEFGLALCDTITCCP